MKARWSERSLQQLEDAYQHIARDNKKAALDFLDAAEALADILAAYPGIGIETDEPGVIVFPLTSFRYLVFYKILSKNEIRIIRLRHASRRR